MVLGFVPMLLKMACTDIRYVLQGGEGCLKMVEVRESTSKHSPRYW